MWPVRHPFWEYLFDLLRFWRAPDRSLRARLYDWSYGEPAPLSPDQAVIAEEQIREILRQDRDS